MCLSMVYSDSYGQFCDIFKRMQLTNFVGDLCDIVKTGKQMLGLIESQAFCFHFHNITEVLCMYTRNSP